MSTLLWMMWVVVAFLLVMGLLTLSGKGDFLLFTAKKPKENYQVGRVRLVYGICALLLAGMIAATALLSGGQLTGPIRWMIAPYFLVIIIANFLRATWCAK